MARIHYIGESHVVAADSDEEIELLDHGRHGGGVIIILGAEYKVDQNRLLLPEGCSRQTARKVKDALEQAAANHKKAQSLRRKFRVI